MVALERCRRAWERTSPQLVIDGWLDMLDELDGLDEAQPSALRLVEPARFHRTPPAGGLESRLTAGDSGMGYGVHPAQSAARVAAPENATRGVPAPAVSRVLNPGAEPCCGPPMGLTASPAAADTGSPVSSAPLQYDGPCRISPEEQRGGGQEGV